MNKDEIIAIANENNGYLYDDIIRKYNIKTIYITRLVTDGRLEKVARGIYITKDGIYDELFINSISYKKMIYSGETALYLNNLSNKHLTSIEATFPYGYNNKNIKNINMKFTRKTTLNLGIIYIDTMFGNKVKTYDKERCICDLFVRPNDYDYEDRVYAINEYKNNYLNYNKLYDYAKQLGVEKEVKNVFEVIGWN